MRILETTNCPTQYVIKSEKICRDLNLFSNIAIEGDLYKKLQQLGDIRAQSGNQTANNIINRSNKKEGYSFRGLLNAIETLGYEFDQIPDDINFLSEFEYTLEPKDSSTPFTTEEDDLSKNIWAEEIPEREQ